jgi:hypothetical protein
VGLDEVTIDSDHFRTFIRERTSVSNIKREMYRQACVDTAEYIISTSPDKNGPFYAHEYLGRAPMLNHCAVLQRDNPDGYCLEFGVGDGTSLNWLRQHRFTYGFDSFLGLPEAWRGEYPKGSFAIDTYRLEEIVKWDSVAIVSGLFEDSLPAWIDIQQPYLDGEGIALIHIDCDLYSSTKFVLDTLRPWIKSGTIIVFDEFWNYPGWDHPKLGEFAAFHEINGSGLEFKCLGYVVDGEQLAVQAL